MSRDTGKASSAKTLSFTELERNLDAIRLRIVKELRAVETVIDGYSACVEACADEKEKAKFRKYLDCLDSWLTEILSEVSSTAAIRARRTDNAGLIGMAAVCCGLSDLPELLARFPESEWDDPKFSDCMGFYLLDHLAPLIHFLECDALQHPERYRLWAREQPYFPMMVFRNVRAYQRRFHDIARVVSLGERCPINSDKRANYDLTKPVNELVFDALMEFLRVFGYLSWGKKTPAGEPTTPEKTLRQQLGVPEEQVSMFIEAFGTPLTKSTAYKWAYKFLIPYLEAEYADWRSVPALKPYIKANGGRSKAKEVIAERLEGMARPDSPGKSVSSRWPS